MYIDIIIGLTIGLLILAAREFQNWKKLKEAGNAIDRYQAQGRELTATKSKLEDATMIINEIKGK